MEIEDRIKRLEALDKTLLWHPFTQMKDWAGQKNRPPIISEARDCFLKDIGGRWYLDGVSSLWVNLFGHRKKAIDQAIKAQLGKVSHSTLLGLAGEKSIELARRLAGLMEESFHSASSLDFPKKIFYSDDGSTAVEVALKMAFQYWRQKGETGRTRFLSLENGYHGDTLGAVSVGGVGIFHDVFRPLLFETYKAPSPYCYRCPMGKSLPECGLACALKAGDILKEHAGEIAAFILEPMVQAAGGMIVSPPGYLKKIEGLCRKYGVLLIADEVATGFGRTGRMFACEHEGVVPDIICLSKGLTGGYLPLAATCCREGIFEAFLGDYAELKTFFHGHSYTGNALGCAAALAALDIFEDERVLESLGPKTALLADWLEKIKVQPHVGDARGQGFFMAGVELVPDKTARASYDRGERVGWRVALRALERGLFIRPLGDVVVIMPPLAIGVDNLKAMLDIIGRSINEITGSA